MEQEKLSMEAEIISIELQIKRTKLSTPQYAYVVEITKIGTGKRQAIFKKKQ